MPKGVRICFGADMARFMSFDEFKLDPGIRALYLLWATKPVGWIALFNN